MRPLRQRFLLWVSLAQWDRLELLILLIPNGESRDPKPKLSEMKRIECSPLCASSGLFELS